MRHALRMRSFSEGEKPLLKALLKIKSKNPEQKLVSLYVLDKESGGDTFSERSLLQSICS